MATEGATADIRLFFGVPLPAQAQEALRAFAGPLRTAGWRMAPAAQLHVTLRFLGETPTALLPALATATREVARATEPFEVRLGALVGLPHPARARVAAARVERGAPELSRLAGALCQALAALGVPAERRPFLAHVTLARSGPRPLALRPSPAGAAVSFRAERLVLWQSRLDPAGARHDVRAEAALGFGGPP